MSKIPIFTEPKSLDQMGLTHQIALLRWVNQGLKDELIELKIDRAILRERISILASMLCDAGVRLPDDLQ